MQRIWVIFLVYLVLMPNAYADTSYYFGNYSCNPKQDKLTFFAYLSDDLDIPTKNTENEVIYSADKLAEKRDKSGDFQKIVKHCHLSSGIFKIALSAGYDSIGGWAWPEIRIFKGNRQLYYSVRYEFIEKSQTVELSGKSGKIRTTSDMPSDSE